MFLIYIQSVWQSFSRGLDRSLSVNKNSITCWNCWQWNCFCSDLILNVHKSIFAAGLQNFFVKFSKMFKFFKYFQRMLYNCMIHKLFYVVAYKLERKSQNAEWRELSWQKNISLPIKLWIFLISIQLVWQSSSRGVDRSFSVKGAQAWDIRRWVFYAIQACMGRWLRN